MPRILRYLCLLDGTTISNSGYNWSAHISQFHDINQCQILGRSGSGPTSPNKKSLRYCGLRNLYAYYTTGPLHLLSSRMYKASGLSPEVLMPR
jgi:hypothetical protein